MIIAILNLVEAFSHIVKGSIPDFPDPLGLIRLEDREGVVFQIVDQEKFFLACIKYGIQYKELHDDRDCLDCADGKLNLIVSNEEITMKPSGTKIYVPDYEVLSCSSCGSRRPTRKSSVAYSKAVMGAEGRLNLIVPNMNAR